MRRTRLLILVCILVILGSVGITYKIQRALQERQAPPTPSRLPENITAQAHDWNAQDARSAQERFRLGDLALTPVLSRER